LARFRQKLTGRKLFSFDRELGYRWVAGADEAGRGSLAGPLVAAAILFDLDSLTQSRRRELAALNDSKQHSEAYRQWLYPRVLKAATKVAVVVRCVRGIDSNGLHVTNVGALRCALWRVGIENCICLVDGFSLPALGYEQQAVPGGDSKSAAIAAASVVAKVTRDRYMQRAEAKHPGFSFATNVGYSTPAHRDAIASNGLCRLHRLSFASVAYTQLQMGGQD
jgi:ribonuclease HII